MGEMFLKKILDKDFEALTVDELKVIIFDFDNTVRLKLFTRHQLLMFTQTGIIIHVFNRTIEPSTLL